MTIHRYVSAIHHPKASSSGCVYEHILVAERALGRYLPDGAEIHHVDENPRNNRPGNLVICQDKGYHKLLHVRSRIVKAGGNPNTHKICGLCKALKPFAEFNRMASNKSFGLGSRCRSCTASGWQAWTAKKINPEGGLSR